MTDKDVGAVDDETSLDSAFLDERSNSIRTLNRSDTLKKWYREPSHRQVLFFCHFRISKSFAQVHPPPSVIHLIIDLLELYIVFLIFYSLLSVGMNQHLS